MPDRTPDRTPLTRWRLVVGTILALSLLDLILQATLVRPYLWPAGPGVTLTGDTVFASLAEPRGDPRLRPPDVESTAGRPVQVTQINDVPGTAASTVAPGSIVTAIVGADGTAIDLSAGLPAPAADVLMVWRQAYRLGTRSPITVRVATNADDHTVTLARPPVWRASGQTRTMWLRQHVGALLHVAAFLAGAVILAALGTRGVTAALMTLALAVTSVANGGALYGAEYELPVVGSLLLIFVWIATPLAFPVIGLAVLHFPRRAPILDRGRWIYVALGSAAAPMFVICVLSAAFLLGSNRVLPALAWLAPHGWIFDLSFAAALAANVLIVIEGVGRYRCNTDLNERRRIQIVVYTGVPAVFAYALKASVPLLSSLAGWQVAFPWWIEGVLQAVVLLPAFALPYAVAVKRVFSPRTVLRQSLQYALARRTLSVLIALPVLALVYALVSDRARPLGDIVLGQPAFYAISLGLAILGFRYRDQAQRWLDRRFFRSEYDAKEILVSLANRVPYENDPPELVSLVVAQIDSALQPESVAVLAGEDARLDVVSAVRSAVTPVPRDGGLATLLRWSDEPLEVFLDDDRSPATRLPAADRAWLQTSGLSLLVPIFAGTGDTRALVGLIALGPKRSEERYTLEDRRLLSSIAAQMSVALDLSRLRRRISTGARPPDSVDGSTSALMQTSTPTTMRTAAIETPLLAMCSACHRCFDLNLAPRDAGTPVCPDDGCALQAVVDIPYLVDGKYRVDAVIGRGGMGTVFRARDLRLERDVAIKVVRAELVGDRDSRARFQREAQIVARLQHPAIVTVFDYGTLPDGAAFLVLEYVRGEDLRRVLRRERQLAPDRAVDLVVGVAAGVEAAHRAGVLHRDLKPENVLLPENGTGPKVVDFGVAKMTDAAAGDHSELWTHGVTIVGTPAYMAPEQLRGESLDTRADVFSLAVLTYEVLTGRLPFGAGSLIDIGIRQGDARSARVATDGLPAGLAPAVLRGLSLVRDERPAGAAAFAQELSASWS